MKVWWVLHKCEVYENKKEKKQHKNYGYYSTLETRKSAEATKAGKSSLDGKRTVTLLQYIIRRYTSEPVQYRSPAPFVGIVNQQVTYYKM